MARIKIELPEPFYFSCIIPVRITDINYGGHVGNDTVLSVIHEARMQFFKHLGYTEMNFAGTGMLMADVAIEFKKELFYGDAVIVDIKAGDISKVGFDLFYKLGVIRPHGVAQHIIGVRERQVLRHVVAQHFEQLLVQIGRAHV